MLHFEVRNVGLKQNVSGFVSIFVTVTRILNINVIKIMSLVWV
jgi:hypothetical protein